MCSMHNVRRPKLTRCLHLSLALAMFALFSGCKTTSKTQVTVDTETLASKYSISKRGHLNCALELHGPIENGDADRFREYIHSLAASNPFNLEYFESAGYANPEKFVDLSSEYGFEFFLRDGELVLLNQSELSICLNSSGGNFYEALEIYDILVELGLGTVVGPNDTCLSACSIIFLGGRSEYFTTMGGNRIFDTDRTMYASATLGFHAPSLFIPESAQQNLEVPLSAVVRSYDDAVRLNSELILRLNENELPILKKILSTPASEMYYVDTVEKTLSLDVEIAAIRVPNRIQEVHIQNACLNASIALVEVVSRYERLGEFESNAPLHWQCEAPQSSAKTTHTSRKFVPVQYSDGFSDQTLIIGEHVMDSSSCSEPGHFDICRVSVELETGSVSVGFWSGTSDTFPPKLDFELSLEEFFFALLRTEVDGSYFDWDDGAEVLYPSQTRLINIKDQ